MSQRKPLTISFSGIDGAGKSTQIARLTAWFEGNGTRVKVITFWDDIVALKQLREGAGHKVFKGDPGVGTPEAPIRRRDKNVQSPLLSVSRMVLYGLDTLSLNRKIKAILSDRSDSRPGVVILDRHLYDELANLNLRRVTSRLYIRFLLRYAWRPDVALVLDADPDAAFARKPEYPLEFLHHNRSEYLKLASIAGLIVISAGTIDRAQADIQQTISANGDIASNQGGSDAAVLNRDANV